MQIFSWSDIKYFPLVSALVKSIRYHRNKHKIVLHLMDFSTSDKKMAESTFAKDDNIRYIYSSYTDFEKRGIKITDKFQYYRNSRPYYFLKLLNESSDDLLTFGANGLVFCDLDYIKKALVSHDFVFLERTKKIQGCKISRIINAHKLIKQGKTFKFPELAKLVLLGTHGISNNLINRSVIENWMNSVENTSNINTVYSDMGLFVDSLIKTYDKSNQKYRIYSAWNEKRAGNSICDTHFLSKNIWFAKSRSKWSKNRYNKMVKFFNRWNYDF